MIKYEDIVGNVNRAEELFCLKQRVEWSAVQSLGKLMVKNVATFPQVLPQIAADTCGIIIKNI